MNVTIKKIFVGLFLTMGFWAQAQHADGVPQRAMDIAPLLIGELAPDLSLLTIEGKEVKLLVKLSEKQTVLIFYRGGWCPYCNLHLAELQGIEKDIVALGYQVIAISPDSPENLKASLDKHQLSYLLLSDANMALSRAFGLAYEVPDASKERLKKSSGGMNEGMLPVPSVFILNKKGEILFEYVDPDYKKRLKGSLLLSVLKELN
jgi:peroxiredoxin